MKLGNLIKSNSWLSIELTLINLYPDQKDIIENYKLVFGKLNLLQPVESDMLIVLTEYDGDPKAENSTYVDVSGRKQNPDPTILSESYALEFIKWEEWLGMSLAPETIQHFNELEIVAHCIYEMTFCGYEETEIQGQFDSIKKTINDYKSLTAEKKKNKTISLDELKKRWKKNGNNERDK